MSHCPGCCGDAVPRHVQVSTPCPGCGHEEEITRLTAENNDHNRWITEMLTNYRIPYDDHIISKRLMLNGFIYKLRAQITDLQEQVEMLTHKADCLKTALFATEDELRKLKEGRG